MRYRRSIQYRTAKPEIYKKFIGLKSKPYEGRSFSIDEHDAKMIVANLPKRDYKSFARQFKLKPYSSFRLLQDFRGR